MEMGKLAFLPCWFPGTSSGIYEAERNTRELTTMFFLKYGGPWTVCLLLSNFQGLLMFLVCVMSQGLTVFNRMSREKHVCALHLTGSGNPLVKLLLIFIYPLVIYTWFKIQNTQKREKQKFSTHFHPPATPLLFPLDKCDQLLVCLSGEFRQIQANSYITCFCLFSINSRILNTLIWCFWFFFSHFLLTFYF